MRIAFLVLNHRGPDQLLRLLSTLRGQLADAPIVVHHDRFGQSVRQSDIEEVDNAHLLTSPRPLAWGDFSIVDACLRSMSWMRDELDFDWVFLLSGQDYPIKPLASLPHDIETLNADVLLRAVPISQVRTASGRRDKRRRYLYQYQPMPTDFSASALRRQMRRGSSFFVNVLNNSQPLIKFYRLPDGMPYRLGLRASSTPFDADNPCWFGSMWFGLSRRAVDYVVTESRDSRVIDYYRRSIVPDESALQTMICNSSELRVAAVNTHYVRWSDPNSGHPDTFTIADLDELLGASEYFARKFTSDGGVLDALDAYLASGPDLHQRRLTSSERPLLHQ